MANIIEEDDIDFALYESETDAAQKVRPAASWIQELIDEIFNPKKIIQSYLPWENTRDKLQFRPGEVTVWGGQNGHGKSLVTGQVALSLCGTGEKVCIASFEMKPLKTIARMGRQWSGINMTDPTNMLDPGSKQTRVDIYSRFKEWSNDKLWLYDQQGTITARQVCAVIRYCAIEIKITHFFIDSLMKCVAGEDDYNGQKNFVDELTAIARDHDIHIHLVHHLKKMDEDNDKPSKSSFKGSGAIADLADNMVGFWRNKEKELKRQEGMLVGEKQPDALLLVLKQRNGDWEGQIKLWFDPQSYQFRTVFEDRPQALDDPEVEFEL